jgi:hypothetical protein
MANDPISPPPVIEPPPRLPAKPQWVVILLSICIGVFLADAIASVIDGTLGLLGRHLLIGLESITGLLIFFMSALVYVLMPFVPAIPRRWFIPLTLFNPLIFLASLPFVIYGSDHMAVIAWCASVGELGFGLLVWQRLQGALKFRWPLVAADRIPARNFSWRSLFSFIAVNAFVLAPAIIIYGFCCSSLAISHFTEGFMALHPGGLTVQVRTYARDDGKTIRLFPMSHVADANFYRQVSQSFPTNSVILMEGVTDEHNLITNQISYKRMAKSLGLAEQHEQFKPAHGRVVRADVDVSIFSKDTIDLLNLVMLFHSRGLNAGDLPALLNFSPSPRIQDELIDDLLQKRNAHLLEQVQLWLPKSDNLMLPWGAAHMPGLSEGIQKAGFHLVQSQDYQVIHFRF